MSTSAGAPFRQGLSVTAQMASVLVLLPALLGRPGQASAQQSEGEEPEDLDLATLLETPPEVWTATKTEQKNSEAPAIITTVTREQIAVWGYRSVSELLGHLLGFYVVDDHSTTNLAVRGISGGLYADGSIVKVLIDGHSVAFQPTAGNWLGPELLPLSAIERVEVMRGPASALFGADAFLGVVSITTRTGSSVEGVAASLRAGRVGRRLATDFDVSAGTEQGRVDVLLGVRRSGQDLAGVSFISPPARTEPEQQALRLQQRSTAFVARVRYRPRATTELKLFGYFSSLERQSQFQAAAGPGAPGSYGTNELALSQVRGGLFWSETLSDRLRLSLRGSLFRGGSGPNDRLEVGNPFYYVQRRFAFRGGDLDGQLDWKPTWAPFGQLQLVAGADLLIDDERLPSRVAVSKLPGPSSVIDAISIYQGSKTFLNRGAYLQGIWDLFASWLSVTAGVRYDRHNVYGGQLSERVGLVSNPHPVVHAKLLYGSAFKAPSPILLHAIPSAVGDVVGNANLRPQRGRTLELQLGYEPGGLLNLSSNVAYGVLDNKTEFVQQGINQVARNVARAATLSWETLVELKYQGILRGRLSFETQKTVRRTGQRGYNEWLLGSDGDIYPTWMAHAGTVIQPPGVPMRAAVTASYLGPRRASATNILLNRRSYLLPRYLLLDATLTTSEIRLPGRVRQTVSFAVSGKNLLGSQGPTPGFSGVDYPLSPRAFFLQTNLNL